MTLLPMGVVSVLGVLLVLSGLYACYYAFRAVKKPVVSAYGLESVNAVALTRVRCVLLRLVGGEPCLHSHDHCRVDTKPTYLDRRIGFEQLILHCSAE